MKPAAICLAFLLCFYNSHAQNRYELNDGWKCLPSLKTKDRGEQISAPAYPLKNWLPAVVPGTVLGTMLENKLVPDPFYGMNNERIPDIFNTGPGHYTWWFIKDFKESIADANEQVWLQLRGVNYSCDIFLNGKKLNPKKHEGMFLRQEYNISSLLRKDGNNRLAIIVYPPNPVGDPNGGQGGDGTIAKNVSHQYVAGWDWIQPVRDRNTGIWDKVFIEKTRAVNIRNPHFVTKVPGVRKVSGPQQPVVIKATVELENSSNREINGVLSYRINGQSVEQNLTLGARAVKEIQFDELILHNPRLWWPNGYGPQELYPVSISFKTDDHIVSDEEKLSVGIREIKTNWNAHTASMQVCVNGQKIFIKGGNWIISDAMLRFSRQRFDAEIRYHRDMNLNLIRIWGGALPERPEFYDACDKYGLLVMQDFWMSGDCNGRWLDPRKKEDQWTRRQYPDDHGLFLRSAADMVKMIRNHASLAIWCGGNEITPPADILVPLRDSILAGLDGTRWFVDYSNSDSMSFNFLGGNGDGPYGIQDIKTFWEHKTWPFNSEIGSVGVGDYESLERFIPAANMIPPQYPSHSVDSVWNYHKYIGYDGHIQPYGRVNDARDFARKAQLVNYDQYRALAEGFTAHKWDWYTGFIIWKTQNPWTAMRGQMYDYYLDPNACLYGLRSGGESLHVMCNPVDGMIMIANNGFEELRDIMLVVKTYDMNGKERLLTQVFTYIGPATVKKILSAQAAIREEGKANGMFLSLQLLDMSKKIISDNFYWFPDSTSQYSGLQSIKQASLICKATQLSAGVLELVLSNASSNPVAFFNRIALIDPKTGKRILPAFYSDNYISVVPGSEKRIVVEYAVDAHNDMPAISVEGWNVPKQIVPVNKGGR
jgi:mannosylglycoprotein endo-beta-mannosidase